MEPAITTTRKATTMETTTLVPNKLLLIPSSLPLFQSTTITPPSQSSLSIPARSMIGYVLPVGGGGGVGVVPSRHLLSLYGSQLLSECSRTKDQNNNHNNNHQELVWFTAPTKSLAEESCKEEDEVDLLSLISSSGTASTVEEDEDDLSSRSNYSVEDGERQDSDDDNDDEDSEIDLLEEDEDGEVAAEEELEHDDNHDDDEELQEEDEAESSHEQVVVYRAAVVAMPFPKKKREEESIQEQPEVPLRMSAGSGSTLECIPEAVEDEEEHDVCPALVLSLSSDDSATATDELSRTSSTNPSSSVVAIPSKVVLVGKATKHTHGGNWRKSSHNKDLKNTGKVQFEVDRPKRQQRSRRSSASLFLCILKPSCMTAAEF
ncbi:hypothetical protein ACA910_013053 [Epithemia clementina (nom. ined.)]